MSGAAKTLTGRFVDEGLAPKLHCCSEVVCVFVMLQVDSRDSYSEFRYHVRIHLYILVDIVA